MLTPLVMVRLNADSDPGRQLPGSRAAAVVRDDFVPLQLSEAEAIAIDGIAMVVGMLHARPSSRWDREEIGPRCWWWMGRVIRCPTRRSCDFTSTCRRDQARRRVPDGKLMGFARPGTACSSACWPSRCFGMTCVRHRAAPDVAAGTFCWEQGFLQLLPSGDAQCPRGLCLHAIHQRRKRSQRRLALKKPIEGTGVDGRHPVGAASQFIDVRIVRYASPAAATATRHVMIATTWTRRSWPMRRIASLYGHRWQIGDLLQSPQDHDENETSAMQTLDA